VFVFSKITMSMFIDTGEHHFTTLFPCECQLLALCGRGAAHVYESRPSLAYPCEMNLGVQVGLPALDPPSEPLGTALTARSAESEYVHCKSDAEVCMAPPGQSAATIAIANVRAVA
jgi:hypothetical protein